jgi:hypothetical protein
MTTYSVAGPDPGYGAVLTSGLDPGWKKIRIRDEHSRSFFRELSNSFLETA